jgi:hypothetical protein
MCFPGIKQEKGANYQGRRAKKHIPCGNQVEKNLEDKRNHSTQGGLPGIGLGRPTPPLGRPTQVGPT